MVRSAYSLLKGMKHQASEEISLQKTVNLEGHEGTLWNSHIVIHSWEVQHLDSFSVCCPEKAQGGYNHNLEVLKGWALSFSLSLQEGLDPEGEEKWDISESGHASLFFPCTSESLLKSALRAEEMNKFRFCLKLKL